MSNKLMYKTSLCSLKKGEKPCYQCSVQHNGTVTKDAVTDDISSQTGLRPAVVTCVLDLLIENLKKGYQNGQRINLGELAGGIVATGSFSGPEEKWDPAKHRLVPYLNTKGALRGCLEAYTPTNVTTGAKVSVKRVLDVVHAVEGLIVGTADVAVQVSGMGLSVDVEAEDEGCWLEAKDGTVAATGQVTAAASTTLDVTFAALPPDGEYTLVVASRGGLDATYGVALGRRKVTVAATMPEEELA